MLENWVQSIKDAAIDMFYSTKSFTTDACGPGQASL